MADRDVTLDVIARDKTGPAIQSVNRNLKSVEKSWKDVDNQGKRTLAAAQKIAGDWGRGLSKISGASKRWADSGDGAGKKFAKGLFSGVEKLAELGGSIGGSLSKAVSAAGPYVQVAMAAVLVGAAIAAAPAVAGAIVGGAALGGVVGGLLIASKDARVKGAFDGLKEEIGTSLQDAAKRFVPATLSAVDEARSSFRRLLPDLKRIFDVSATWVAPLTRSLGRAAEMALRGITEAVMKAGPIIGVIGKGIEGIGKAVGQTFASLSDNGASMALALKGLFWLLEATIRGVGAALNLLVEGFEFFVNKIPGGKRLLDSMTSSQDGAKTSAFNLAGGFQAVAGDANGAAAGITNAKQAADDLVNGNISLARAQIAAREATRATSSAITENSKAKLTNKQRSDQNMTALLNMADAFNTETTAGDKSKIGAGKAAAAYSTNRAALIKMAEKAGYSTTKAQELADRLLTMPKNVNIGINANTGPATTKLETFQKKIDGLHGKTVTVQVKTNGDHYIPGVGTQVKNSGYNSWQGARDSGGTSRTVGGPTKVESTVNQTLTVSLDGQPFYSFTSRAISERERRTAYRQKVGKR